MNPLRLIFLSMYFAHHCEVEAYFQSVWNGLNYIVGAEYCGKDWIDFKFDVLQNDLKQNLFGQPLVKQSVAYALKAHFDKGDRSQKALVLSFHGMQGSGKNYVSDFIAKSIYMKHASSASKFVHFFNGRLMFPLERHVYTYKHQLETTIQNALTKCPESMFIFDEVDKMPRGVLDVLKPYIDYRREVQGVVARKAVFIFLSNTGSRAIMEKYLEYWNSGVDRDTLTLNDFDNVIRSGAFNEDGKGKTNIFYNSFLTTVRILKFFGLFFYTLGVTFDVGHSWNCSGGLQLSDNIEFNLIDHYIPFLPLEKSHVKECISKEMKQFSNITDSEEEKIIDEVFKTITFGPSPEKLFSTSGCKRISQQVSTMVTKLEFLKQSDLKTEL